MRIALLASANSIHTIRIANSLVEYGHEVHLITQHKVNSALSPKIMLYQLPFRNFIGYFLNVFRLIKLLKKLNPNVLNAHYASGYGTLARLSGFHPTALSIWGSDVYLFPYRSKLHKRLLVNNLEYADNVFSTSHAMAKQASKIGCASNKIKVTPFGIDTVLFKPGALEANDKIVIGTVKSLNKVYGVDILIQAFAHTLHLLKEQKQIADKLHLMIAGDGPEQTNLINLTKRLAIEDKVTFSGRIPHAKVTEYLQQFTVYMALSRSESFGVAVLEASACALPVIVSDVGGLVEVVRHAQTGLIVPVENYEAAAQALCHLLLQQELAKKLGLAGREWVENHYSWQASVQLIEKHLMQLALHA